MRIGDERKNDTNTYYREKGKADKGRVITVSGGG